MSQGAEGSQRVDPLDAPDDYADPWRANRYGGLLFLLVGLVLIALVVVLAFVVF